MVLLDRQRAARLEPSLHRQRNDGAEPAPGQGSRRRHPRTARRWTEPAGDREPLRATDVRAGPEEERSRTDTRQRLRRDHPERLPAGARGDRPRRAARRGEAGHRRQDRQRRLDVGLPRPAARRRPRPARRATRSPVSGQRACQRGGAERRLVQPFAAIRQPPAIAALLALARASGSALVRDAEKLGLEVSSRLR